MALTTIGLKGVGIDVFSWLPLMLPTGYFYASPNIEDTRNLMRFSRTYMKKFGKPRSYYVDKDSIYVTNRHPSLEEELLISPSLFP